MTKRKKAKPPEHLIFSGEYSRDMWNFINAVTDPEASHALYVMGCRLQEFEARFQILRLQSGKSGD